jgi:hypothetical protein
MEDLACPQYGTDVFDQLYFKMWADINVDISATAGVTLIVSFHPDTKTWLTLPRVTWEI